MHPRLGAQSLTIVVASWWLLAVSICDISLHASWWEHSHRMVFRMIAMTGIEHPCLNARMCYMMCVVRLADHSGVAVV